MTIFKWTLPFLFGLSMGIGLPACGTVKLNVKTWYLDRDQAEAIKPDGIMIRKHDNAPTEVKTAAEARGDRCLNKADFDLLMYLAKQNGVRGID